MSDNKKVQVNIELDKADIKRIPDPDIHGRHDLEKIKIDPILDNETAVSEWSMRQTVECGLPTAVKNGFELIFSGSTVKPLVYVATQTVQKRVLMGGGDVQGTNHMIICERSLSSRNSIIPKEILSVVLYEDSTGKFTKSSETLIVKGSYKPILTPLK
jgi:hypothetical protein